GVVIAFGIAVSTVLGRFVIPIYYVLGERLIDRFSRPRGEGGEPRANAGGRRSEGHGHGHAQHRVDGTVIRPALPMGALPGDDGHSFVREIDRVGGGPLPGPY